MSKSNLQSLKAKNAVTITTLHKHIKARRTAAKKLFAEAYSQLKAARKETATVKKLAGQQISIKRDLKGPPKAKRAPKADSRIVAVAVNPKVGADFAGITVGVTGGAVSIAS